MRLKIVFHHGETPSAINLNPPSVIAEIRNEDFGLTSMTKLFDAQALVTEFAIETLIGAVLPRFARIDEREVELGFFDPLQDAVADEFWTVIRSQVRGRHAR